MSTAAQEPLVSVALATCNGARFLRQQLDSIDAQTVGGIEVVASDDASDDDTCDILAAYAGPQRLRLLRNERRLGVKANFENALRHCRGRFVALSDQDDVWHADKLSALLDRLQKGGASLVYSDAELIDERSAAPGPRLRETLQVEYLRGRPRSALYLENCVTGCTLMCRRDLLELALPIPEGAHMHDWWLAFAATLADGIDFIDRPLLGYRQHGLNQLGASAPRLHPLASGMQRLLNPVESVRRLRRARRWQARNLRHLQACAQLEERVGADSQLSRALLAWLRDQRRCWSLQQHRDTFARHPELFRALAPARREAAMQQRLWSLPRLGALTLAHIGAAALPLVAAAGALLP